MLIVQFTDVRCVGRKQAEGEKRTSGIYYKQNGDKNAMFAGRFVDADGEFRRVEFYNAQGSQPGKGLADLAAKWITKGKTISFLARSKVIEIDYRNPADNFDMVVHNGNALKTESTVYRAMPGTLVLGASRESANQIAEETKNFDPANPSVDAFFRRPANWNIENHTDQAIWKDIMNARKGASYHEGDDYYGHALVWDAKKSSSNARTDEQKVAQATDVVQSVGGITLQALREKGWTDAQLLADPTYNVLMPKPAATPEPPANTETPSPPGQEAGADEPIYA